MRHIMSEYFTIGHYCNEISDHDKHQKEILGIIILQLLLSSIENFSYFFNVQPWVEPSCVLILTKLMTPLETI